MKIRYEQGNTLENSYFIAEEEGRSLKIKASDFMPLEAQRLIKAKKEDQVITPDEAIKQMEEEYKSFDELRKAYIKARVANRIALKKEQAKEQSKKEAKKEIKDKAKKETKKQEKQTKASLKRKAYDDGWAIDRSEIPKDVGKRVKEPVMSVNDKEVASDKKQQPIKTVSNPKVKKYYNRLPSKSIGAEPTMSVDRKSSKVIKALNAKLEDLKNKLEEKDKEIEQLKNRESRKVIAEKVELIIQNLIKAGKIDPENEKEREEAIKKYSKLDEKGLDLFLELFEKTSSEENKESEQVRQAGLNKGNIPGSYPSHIGTKTKSDVEIMSEIWSK
ncbi:MAG: hypothetical protein ACTSPI_08520 [Candidatus Heimdallarchaeaceae archaeon]